jgi:hypothetical protein
MDEKITRRALVAIAGSAAALAQTMAPAPPAAQDEDVAKARARLGAIAAQLEKVKVPIFTEPAAHFKA